MQTPRRAASDTPIQLGHSARTFPLLLGGAPSPQEERPQQPQARRLWEAGVPLDSGAVSSTARLEEEAGMPSGQGLI